MGRMRISSGAPWEITAGYSRAVRTGGSIFVSGTTAMRDGALVGEDDAGAQTRRILEIIAEALNQTGSSLNDVVRVRMFVTGQAHIAPVLTEISRVFREIRPAATIVVVTALIDPRMLVEIEVDAVAGSAATD
jgi:enamine deaminase RidA (YjgF/YER057c/UK114 family)